MTLSASVVAGLAPLAVLLALVLIVTRVIDVNTGLAVFATPQSLPLALGPSDPCAQRQRFARALLWIVPLFCSSNYLIARAASGVIGPHSLALGRWRLAFLLMLPLAWRGLRQAGAPWLAAEWRQLLAGALGHALSANQLVVWQKVQHRPGSLVIFPLQFTSCVPELIHSREVLRHGVTIVDGLLQLVDFPGDRFDGKHECGDADFRHGFNRQNAQALEFSYPLGVICTYWVRQQSDFFMNRK